MWPFLLCFVLLLFYPSGKCENQQTNNGTDFLFTPATNSTVNNKNLTDNVKQPSERQVERTLVPVSENISVSTSPSNSSLQTFSDFKPSPHLESYYEFNKFPVPPAFPEGKHHKLDLFPSNVQWPEKEGNQGWRVKFPTAPTSSPNERPYQFQHEDRTHGGKSYNSYYPSKHDGYAGSKPVLEKPASYGNKVPVLSSIGVWDKNGDRRKPSLNPILHKTTNSYDYPIEKPYSGKGHFDFQAEIGPHQHHEMQHPGQDKWQKIIKILTAIIPIGLLISALTPTVITVTPMNGTQTRSRAEDSASHQTKRLISSINYFSKLNSYGCEDRVLCELLLTASTSKNAEHHVDNLLNNFTQHGKAVERAEDMKRVFEAVKKQNCNPIICQDIKEKT